jgi:hydroxyacylglutathione hydrolase
MRDHADAIPAPAGAVTAWSHPALTIVRLSVSPLRANCYLLACRATGAVLVVDAGDEAGRILAALARLTDGMTEQVAAIVNTHGHVDHTAAVGALRAALGPVPVLMGPLDSELVLGNGPDAARLLGREYLPVLPNRPLADGDEIRWGACAFRVLATPGHSPGGVCLYGHGVLLSGDTLLRGTVGSWRGFKGDRLALLASIRERLLPLPPGTAVYPGHGEPTTLAAEATGNRFVNRAATCRARSNE